MPRINWKALYSNISLLLFISIITLSCSESPQKRLQQYLQYSYLRQDEHKAYQMLSAEDRKYKSEKEFLDILQQEYSYSKNFITENKDLFGFKIVNIEDKNSDTVRIKVLMEKPNSVNLIESILSLSVTPHTGGFSSDKRKKIMEKELEELLKNPVLTKETEEKEYVLIREGGVYSVFLNLGSSDKKAELDEIIVKMENEAEEKLRKIDFQGAKRIYQKIKSNYPESEMDYRIDEINKIQNKTVKLGDQIQTGNLNIVPLGIELKNAALFKKNWVGHEPIVTLTPEPCMALTFEITNVGDGEIFDFFDTNRFKRKNSIRDNFGNEMKEYFVDYDIISVEGNNMKPIKPGETRKIVALCEAALSPKASRFLWDLQVLTDNKKTLDHVYISFTRGQIKGGE